MRGNSGCASCHFKNSLRMSTGSTARPLGSRSSIPLLRYRSGSRASSRFSRSSHCFSSVSYTHLDVYKRQIFYFSDQQRWDTCGCFGQPLNVTPNLDKLAEEGVKRCV